MRFARVAQLVEHTLGKGEVTGSIPVASSEVKIRLGARDFGIADGASPRCARSRRTRQ
jgi:hypothetical protein